MTVLMNEVNDSKETIVKLLIDGGADLNLKNTIKETALMMAAKQPNERIVKLLIKAGADLNLINMYEETALNYAINGDNEINIELLIDSGIIISPQNIFWRYWHPIKNKEIIRKILMKEPCQLKWLMKSQDFNDLLRIWNEIVVFKTNWKKLMKEIPIKVKKFREAYKIQLDFDTMTFNQIPSLSTKILNLLWLHSLNKLDLNEIDTSIKILFEPKDLNDLILKLNTYKQIYL